MVKPTKSEVVDKALERVLESVKKEVAASGKSLRQIARETGLDHATLVGLMAGRGNPTVKTLLAIADNLQISAAKFLD